MPANLQDTTTLNNGVKMPWFGLGVFKVEDGSQTVESVKAAIKAGYRSIDTAAIYKNEEGVGQGIREALEANGLSREDLFITSKVWNADQGYESAIKAYEASLERLGLEYLDLYLIHWPGKDKYKETWKALEKLYKDGRVRSIGVSNFQVHHLEDILQDAEVVPVVNQVEYHPRLAQVELLSYCKDKGIQLEAWSPLMQGKIFEIGELNAIAEKYQKSVAQIVLRWDLQNGVVTIPKSIKEQRIIENADIFNFELSDEEMNEINDLNKDERVGPNPDEFLF
jgi:diketogulonate reductase-like aldo/keto reductase